MAEAKEKDRGDFDIEDRLINFAVQVIRCAEGLPKSVAANHIAGQMIRCGTSPAANYGEAQAAESRSDFLHKMMVCLKELRETRVWLLMASRADLLTPTGITSLLNENDQLIAIFVKSIKTTKSSGHKPA